MAAVKMERREEVNENGVSVTTFSEGGKDVGRMYRTYHPTIPFEVYRIDPPKLQRVMTIEEAEEWLSAALIF